jgi:hypothetical protein
MVLGAGRSAAGLAAAVAGELRTLARAPAVVVLVWCPSGPVLRPASHRLPARAARRAAAWLADAHAAPLVVRRRSVWMMLPDDPEAAAALADGVQAASPDPVVLVIAGPRPEAFEPLLALQSAVIVARRAVEDDGIAALAEDGIRARGIPSCAAVAPTGVRAWLALGGWGRSAALRDLASGPSVARAARPEAGAA